MEIQEDLTQNFSISDFKNFMAIPLSSPVTKPISRLHVFSNSGQESEPRKRTSNFSNFTTKRKIKQALELFDSFYFPTLVQFWAPTITETQQQFLDTSELPFGLSVLRKGLCLFRKHCLNHRYSVDGDGCGPPGRVFRRRYPEFCPDVGYYSVEEYGLRDFAVAIGIRGYLSLPVYEPDWQYCIGVLEILTVMDGSYCLTNVIEKVSDSLKEVGLKSSDVFWPFDMKQLAYNQLENGLPEYELALDEIQKVLDVLCKMYKLPFAQTWVVTSNESSEESIKSTAKKGSYMSINKVSSFQKDCIRFLLRKGQGIVWKAFSSGTSCFCRDVTHLSIIDYALALSARKADLTAGFAICLQSSYTGTAVYVIELFLPPDQNIYEQPWNFLSSILVSMKQQFKTFKLGSGEEVGNELPVSVLKISKDDPLDSFRICQTMHAGAGLKNQGKLIFEVGAKKSGPKIAKIKETTASSSSVCECSQDGEMVQSHDTTAHNRRNELNLQQTIFPARTKIGVMKALSLGEAISPQVLGKQYGKRPTNFPDDPSVKKSTSNNLSSNRWAPRKRRKVDCPFIQHKSKKEAERHMEGPTSVSSRSPVATPMQNEGSIMTVKAHYEGDIIKFRVPVASGVMKLKDEVMKRLKLSAGTFEIKYHREDDIWFLLDSDARLQEYMNAIRSSGISTIKVFIMTVVRQSEAMENEAKMTVKASYKDDLIKFQLSHSAGMLELKNEMIKRLKLEDGSFEIKYADENSCQILLDSDAALQNCISKVTSLQKTTMKLSIHPIRTQTATSNECTMMVKASYGDDIIKFQLSPSSGMMNLNDEVTKRLKLEAGSFVIKYLDGDNEILLDGEAALAKHMSTMTSMGRYTFRISLQPTKQ